MSSPPPSSFDGKDAYSLLGIANGLEATEAEIKKSYRKLALKWHPDKNKDKDPKLVAEKFDKLQKAYDLLTDAKAREALDNLLRVQLKRENRFRKENEKRLKLVKELETKERESSQAKRQEEEAATQLQRELERLREKMSRKQHADPNGNGVSTSSSQKHNSMHPQFDTAGERRRSLKASWTKSSQGKDYTVAQLKRLFEQFGPVQDVVVKDKATKATAIVVMKDSESVRKALGSVCGDLSNPLLVVPLSKDLDAGGIVKAEEPPPRRNQTQKNTSHLSASFENDVLAKLRAAAKRKREAQATE